MYYPQKLIIRTASNASFHTRRTFSKIAEDLEPTESLPLHVLGNRITFSYKLHIKRILRIIVTILGTIVREYMTTRHRRFEGISIEIEPLHGSSNDRRSARDA